MFMSSLTLIDSFPTFSIMFYILKSQSFPIEPYHRTTTTKSREIVCHWILAVKPRHLPNLQIFSFRWLHHFNDTFHFTSPTSHLCEKKWPTTGEFQREWRFFWGFPWVWTVIDIDTSQFDWLYMLDCQNEFTQSVAKVVWHGNLGPSSLN